MNWPDPGSSSPPPEDNDGAAAAPDVASEPQPGDEPPAVATDTSEREPGPDREGASDEAVWLSSDDLASSPRPWEDRDPAHLPVEDPRDPRSEGPQAGEPARETPTYAQLRSEAEDRLGRWQRTGDDPAGGTDRPGPEPDDADGAPPGSDVPTDGPEWHAEGDVRYDGGMAASARDLPPGGTVEDASSAAPQAAEPHDSDVSSSAPQGGSWDAPEEVSGGDRRAPEADEEGAGGSPTPPPDEARSGDPLGAAAGPGSADPAAAGAPGEDEHVPEGEADLAPSAEPGPPHAAPVAEATAGDAFHGEHQPAPDRSPAGPAPDPPFHGEHPETSSDGVPFHGERPGVGAPPARTPAATVIEDALAGLEETVRSATVICVANQKGGVGKTTTTVSLGAALAMEGAQVLVVDLDPQGNATTGLGLRAQEGAPSTYRVIVEQMDVEDAAEPTAVRGLHVLPSSLDLAGAEIELVPAFSRENRLKQALDAVRDLYDVILIDCPPSLGLLTINALVAADQVLVPIQCEYYALEGLGQLMRTVKLVADSLNRGLAVGGVVLTMFDGRTNLSQQVADEVRGYFGDIAYQTIVPRTVRLSEAPSYGQPIGVFDAASRGARAYQRLAREVARRLELELETEEVSPLDRLLGPTTPPPPTDEASPLPTDLAPEDVPGTADVTPTGAGSEAGQPADEHHHEDHRHHDDPDEHRHDEHHDGHRPHAHHDDEPVPGTEGQP